MPNEISRIIWKNLEVDSAVTFRPEPWKFGVGGDPLDHRVSFCFQAGAQSRLNLFVVANGLVKLLLGFFEDFELHEG